MVTAKPFDAAEYLDTPEMIAAYLTEAFESGDHVLITKAIGAAARSASRSSAAQTWPWVSIRGVFGCLAMRKSGAGSGNYCRNRPFPQFWVAAGLGGA